MSKTDVNCQGCNQYELTIVRLTSFLSGLEGSKIVILPIHLALIFASLGISSIGKGTC